MHLCRNSERKGHQKRWRLQYRATAWSGGDILNSRAIIQICTLWTDRSDRSRSSSSSRAIIQQCTLWRDRSDRSPSSSSRCLPPVVICRPGSVCIVQIQPRKHVPDHADYTAPTRQRELDHTDHTDEESICPERSRSCNGNRSYKP